MQPSKQHFLAITKHNKTEFLAHLWFLCSFWKANFTNILGSCNTVLRDNSHQRTGTVNPELRTGIKRDCWSQRATGVLTHQCEREEKKTTLIRKKAEWGKENWRKSPAVRITDMDKCRNENHCQERYLLYEFWKSEVAKGTNFFQVPGVPSSTSGTELDALGRWFHPVQSLKTSLGSRYTVYVFEVRKQAVLWLAGKWQSRALITPPSPSTWHFL